MPLNRGRAVEIMDIAFVYWSGFVGYAPEHRYSLFERNAWVNPCAVAFFRYCSEILLGVAGATVAPTSLLVNSGSPSWLWHQGGGVPRILVDFKSISEGVPSHAERKTISRIILHEVGHLVLHFNHLKSLPQGPVQSVTADQEEEAWFFSGAVVALALGDLAPTLRPSIKDAAWRAAV